MFLFFLASPWRCGCNAALKRRYPITYRLNVISGESSATTLLKPEKSHNSYQLVAALLHVRSICTCLCSLGVFGVLQMRFFDIYIIALFTWLQWRTQEFWCRIHLRFRYVGGFVRKVDDVTAYLAAQLSRLRAHHRNKLSLRVYCCCCRCILHLQQYSRRLDWTCFFFYLSLSKLAQAVKVLTCVQRFLVQIWDRTRPPWCSSWGSLIIPSKCCDKCN